MNESNIGNKRHEQNVHTRGRRKRNPKEIALLLLLLFYNFVPQTFGVYTQIG